VGTVPIRINMISPCPLSVIGNRGRSLTAVQVKISKPRIHHAGGFIALRRAVQFGLPDQNFHASSNSAAAKKPMSGDNSSAFPTLVACPQSTPEVPSWTVHQGMAMPTPMIDPISVCELDAGSPRIPGTEVSR